MPPGLPTAPVAPTRLTGGRGSFDHAEAGSCAAGVSLSAGEAGRAMTRVTLTPEAIVEAKALLQSESLDGVDPARRVLRIGIGSCGLRRPVASATLAEPDDERLEVAGIPIAIAASLSGCFRIGVGRGRFGSWLTVELCAEAEG